MLATGRTARPIDAGRIRGTAHIRQNPVVEDVTSQAEVFVIEAFPLIPPIREAPDIFIVATPEGDTWVMAERSDCSHRFIADRGAKVRIAVRIL